MASTNPGDQTSPDYRLTKNVPQLPKINNNTPLQESFVGGILAPAKAGTLRKNSNDGSVRTVAAPAAAAAATTPAPVAANADLSRTTTVTSATVPGSFLALDDDDEDRSSVSPSEKPAASRFPPVLATPFTKNTWTNRDGTPKEDKKDGWMTRIRTNPVVVRAFVLVVLLAFSLATMGISSTAIEIRKEARAIDAGAGAGTGTGKGKGAGVTGTGTGTAAGGIGVTSHVYLSTVVGVVQAVTTMATIGWAAFEWIRRRRRLQRRTPSPATVPFPPEPEEVYFCRAKTRTIAIVSVLIAFVLLLAWTSVIAANSQYFLDTECSKVIRNAYTNVNATASANVNTNANATAAAASKGRPKIEMCRQISSLLAVSAIAGIFAVIQFFLETVRAVKAHIAMSASPYLPAP